MRVVYWTGTNSYPQTIKASNLSGYDHENYLHNRLEIWNSVLLDLCASSCAETLVSGRDWGIVFEVRQSATKVGTSKFKTSVPPNFQGYNWTFFSTNVLLKPDSLCVRAGTIRSSRTPYGLRRQHFQNYMLLHIRASGLEHQEWPPDLCYMSGYLAPSTTCNNATPLPGTLHTCKGLAALSDSPSGGETTRT